MKETEILDPESGDDIAAEATAIKERFAIDSDEKAEWYLRKLANLEAEKDRLHAQFGRMLAGVQAEHERLSGRFGAEFEAYCRERIAGRRDKKKYHDFFQGRVSVRSVAARLSIGSMDDALTTARVVCPSAVVVESVERFDKAAFLAYAQERFDAEGELLPGIDRTPAGESFLVAFPKAGKKGEE